MKKNYFLCKVKHTKQNENGESKKVIETFLFQVDSFTEAESAVYAQCGTHIAGEFEITSITPYKLDYVRVESDGADELGNLYRAVFNFEFDGDNGKTKVSKLYGLTNVPDIERVSMRFEDVIDASTTIASISKVNIDYFIE